MTCRRGLQIQPDSGSEGDHSGDCQQSSDVHVVHTFGRTPVRPRAATTPTEVYGNADDSHSPRKHMGNNARATMEYGINCRTEVSPVDDPWCERLDRRVDRRCGGRGHRSAGAGRFVTVGGGPEIFGRQGRTGRRWVHRSGRDDRWRSDSARRLRRHSSAGPNCAAAGEHQRRADEANDAFAELRRSACLGDQAGQLVGKPGGSRGRRGGEGDRYPVADAVIGQTLSGW